MQYKLVIGDDQLVLTIVKDGKVMDVLTFTSRFDLTEFLAASQISLWKLDIEGE